MGCTMWTQHHMGHCSHAAVHCRVWDTCVECVECGIHVWSVGYMCGVCVECGIHVWSVCGVWDTCVECVECGHCMCLLLCCNVMLLKVNNIILEKW